MPTRKNRKHTTHRKRKQRTQYKRHRGGQGCGSCGCPIGGLSIDKMNSFVPNYKQNGGHFYKPAGPMPGPFVGQPWGPKIIDWPGAQGIGNDQNYLKSYGPVIGNDPSRQTQLYDTGSSHYGGKRARKTKKTRRRKTRGGGDFGNLASELSFNAKSAYNALNGYPSPVNPLPYKDQMVSSFNKPVIL